MVAVLVSPARRYSWNYVLITCFCGEVVMKIGVYMFPTEYSMGLVDLAVALEERGEMARCDVPWRCVEELLCQTGTEMGLTCSKKLAL